MKIIKLKKTIESTILERKIKNFNFFTLEYDSNAKIFLKKTKISTSFLFNKEFLKHPIKLNNFKSFNELKFYLNKENINIIYIYINKVYIKQKSIKNVYIQNDIHITNLLMYLTVLYKLFFFNNLILLTNE
jgi:hypothetical protein